MKTVICPKFDPQDVLEIAEIEKRVTRQNETLVRLYTHSVNFAEARISALEVEEFMKFVILYLERFLSHYRGDF